MFPNAFSLETLVCMNSFHIVSFSWFVVWESWKKNILFVTVIMLEHKQIRFPISDGCLTAHWVLTHFFVHHHHMSSVLLISYSNTSPFLHLFLQLCPFLDPVCKAKTSDLELLGSEGRICSSEGSFSYRHTVSCSVKRLHEADLRQEGNWTQSEAVTQRLGLSQRNNTEKAWCLSPSQN